MPPSVPRLVPLLKMSTGPAPFTSSFASRTLAVAGVSRAVSTTSLKGKRPPSFSKTTPSLPIRSLLFVMNCLIAIAPTQPLPISAVSASGPRPFQVTKVTTFPGIAMFGEAGQPGEGLGRTTTSNCRIIRIQKWNGSSVITLIIKKSLPTGITNFIKFKMARSILGTISGVTLAGNKGGSRSSRVSA